MSAQNLCSIANKIKKIKKVISETEKFSPETVNFSNVVAAGPLPDLLALHCTFRCATAPSPGTNQAPVYHLQHAHAPLHRMKKKSQFFHQRFSFSRHIQIGRELEKVNLQWALGNHPCHHWYFFLPRAQNVVVDVQKKDQVARNGGREVIWTMPESKCFFFFS